MAQVTMKDLGRAVDVQGVISEARTNWEREQRKRLSVEQWLLRLLPFGLVVLVATFFLLSAPHTISMLDMITPGFGWVAPVGFEIGILIISALIEAGWRGWLTYPLLALLIVMAIAINTVGAFMVVVNSTATPDAALVAESIGSKTFTALLAQFPTLPATVQATLILVVPVGIAVPVISKFAGEAVVKLALGKVVLSESTLDERWAEVESRVARSALIQAAIDLGAGTKTAGNWATGITEQIYMTDVIGTPTLQPDLDSGLQMATANQDSGGQGTGQRGTAYGFAVSPQSNRNEPHRPLIDNKDSPGQGTGDRTAGQANLTQRMVIAWLQDNGDSWRDMSNQDIAAAITGQPNGYKTVQRVLRKLDMRR